MAKGAWVFVLVSLFLTAGCAYGPRPGAQLEATKMLLDLPYDKAWERCLTVLSSRGLAVANADRSKGSITTTRQVSRFDPAEEDCGNMLNLPLLEENPGDVTVLYELRLVSEGPKTAITIDAFIRPLSPPLVHTHNVQTFCYSMGVLEKALREAILAGQSGLLR